MRHEIWLKLFLQLGHSVSSSSFFNGDSLGYQTTAHPAALLPVGHWTESHSPNTFLFKLLCYFWDSNSGWDDWQVQKFPGGSPELFTSLFTHWWMSRWILIHPAPECLSHEQTNCSWCFSNCLQNLTKEIPWCSASVRASPGKIPLVYTLDTRRNVQGSDPRICWGSSILTSELSLLFLLQLFPLFPTFSIVNKRTWKICNYTWKGFCFLTATVIPWFCNSERKKKPTTQPFSLKAIHLPKDRTLQSAERREETFIFK